MRSILRLMCAAFLLAPLGGCIPLAAIAYKTTGPRTKPAEYPLGQKPTLVFVENYVSPDLYAVESERLQHDITDVLKENKAGVIISSSRLEDLQSKNSDAFAKMSIPQIGEALGAAQVIYVNLASFKAEPTPGGEMVHGSARAMVKVVDVATGRTLWPPDSSAGREVKFETPDVRDLESADAPKEKVYQKLTAVISNLFYNAPTDDMEDDDAQP